MLIDPAMQQTFPITDQELESLATYAVSNVFNMMLETDATLEQSLNLGSEEYEDGVELPLDRSEAIVAGTVGFIGPLIGVIYIFLDMPSALKATSKLLGLTQEEIEEEGNETVNDAVGELTNMIVGAFKNELSNKGYECQMTIPSILRGSNFSIEPAEAGVRRIYKFGYEGRSFVIDILMKEE